MPLRPRFLTGILISAAVCGACHNPGSTAAPAAPVAASIPPGVLALSADEARVRDYVRAHHDDDIMLLERAVNLSSGTLNPAGVRQVGTLFGAELAAMGFDVHMSETPTAMHRGGDLIAEHAGTHGPRLLLIGHLDPTAAGAALLAQFDAVSRSLGYGPVEGDPPESRGAGDISFMAPYLTGMDGLGVSGRGAHSPEAQ